MLDERRCNPWEREADRRDTSASMGYGMGCGQRSVVRLRLDAAVADGLPITLDFSVPSSLAIITGGFSVVG